MIIANPIYDTVFKFLMEDHEVAKQLLSAIIGEEIVELEVRPQEQTTPSDRFLLTVFRVDFKAIIRTADGTQKKVLIELQKSNHAFDIPRFRQYLGSNYVQPDIVDGIPTNLPLLPIYFLGFPLTINKPVLKIGRNYQDVSTGQILNEKDDFIEHLSHDCFVVQIRHLPAEHRTRLEKLLSVFDQRFVMDPAQKWLLQFPGDTTDEDLRLILRRLMIAAETPEMKEKINIEETFDRSMESALREKEMIIERKEAEIEKKDAEIEELMRKIAALENPKK